MTARIENVGGFILAGGASSRMGRDKAFIELDGEPLILRAAKLLEPIVGRATIIGPPERFASLGLHAIPDDHPGFGPLGGIATALRAATHSWNLIIGCDLPFLTGDWLEFLIQRALESRADAIVPLSEHGAEPLCAMYHQKAGAHIRAALEKGVRKITQGLEGLAIVNLAPNESKPFDSAGLLFKNINTPDDYDSLLVDFDRKFEKKFEKKRKA
jgi:molybdopterin-guanine dinucleotide biosynthesis protein A